MSTTVFFATNRVVGNAADAVRGYGASMVAPSDPTAISYGTAFVDGIDVASGTPGTVSRIVETARGGFSPAARDDLARAGRNLLVFIHGFDNTFVDAITFAAFNREWLAASGVPAANTTVIAFAWPSRGQAFSFPIPQADYLADQNMARQSGLPLMAFLANLDPILRTARAQGHRTTLLVHSMGNLALQSAVENWFLHGNGTDMLFDHAILAAADCQFNCFAQPGLALLSGLDRLAGRVSVCYSGADHVLQLSLVVNLGAQRLGQDGPQNRTDANSFPPARYTMVDCTAHQDYAFDFFSSHLYYRRSPAVRAIIAADM